MPVINVSEAGEQSSGNGTSYRSFTYKPSLIAQLNETLPPILEAAQGLKQTTRAGSYAGPCPICREGDDRFYIKPDGRFGCGICKNSGDKIDFYCVLKNTDIKGLAKMYLQPDIKRQKARTIKDNLVKTYAYQNEAGEVLYETRKYEEEGCDKTFRQSHYNDAGKAVAGLGDVRRVLYNLPGILSSDYIVLCEGEKDADRLIQNGITATTSPMGASAWKADCAKFLKGKHVAILPDNDEPGQRHAAKVAKDLLPIAESVRIVELPGLPNKGDVSDWFDAGGTAEVLHGIISNTPVISGATKAYESNKALFTLTHISDIKSKAPEWIIKGLVEYNSVAQIFGDPGTGKSFLAIAMAACISTDTPFYGVPVKPGIVIYIAGEGQSGIKRRFTAWAIRNGIDLNTANLFVSLAPAALCDAELAAMVTEAVDKVAEEHGRPAMIVFDTVARNFGPGDENSTQDMGRFIMAVDALKAKYQSGILLVHHSGHADKSRARGAMALKGALDFEYRVDKDETGTVRMECTKIKDHEPPAPMAFKFCTVELPDFDEDVNPVCSAILDSTSFEPPAVPGKIGRGKHQINGLRILRDMYQQYMKNLEDDGRDPSSAKVMEKHWRDAYVEDGMPRTRFYAIKKSLEEAGEIKVENGFVYV